MLEFFLPIHLNILNQDFLSDFNYERVMPWHDPTLVSLGTLGTLVTPNFLSFIYFYIKASWSTAKFI
jgi:hypothetical protein